MPAAGPGLTCGCKFVSDIAGVAQQVPEVTLGAAYGDAMLAAMAAGAPLADVRWNRPLRVIEPRPDSAEEWQPRYALYRALYEQTQATVHEMGRWITDA